MGSYLIAAVVNYRENTGMSDVFQLIAINVHMFIFVLKYFAGLAQHHKSGTMLEIVAKPWTDRHLASVQERQN